jgi:hypothetical protein
MSLQRNAVKTEDDHQPGLRATSLRPMANYRGWQCIDWESKFEI